MAFIYQACDDEGACSTAQVWLNVMPVNDSPIAVDDNVSTAEDTTETILVTANDIDVDTDPLTVVSLSPVSHGTVITAGNTVIYTPTNNFNGTDNFTYTVTDGTVTDTAAVTLTVIATNDAPVAVVDTYTTTVGITLTVLVAQGVLSNDTDVDTGDTLTAIKVSDPISGSLTLNPDGSFTYVPNTGFIGIDTFIYRAEDSIMVPSNATTVTISVS